MIRKLSILLVLGLLTQSGCYSFKGTAIAPEINTFYVSPFENRAANVVPTLSQTFTEQLKDKIRSESKLRYTDTDPDIEFSGYISDYRVRSVAPQEGETTAFNRLEIKVYVEYKNLSDESDTWKETFSFYDDYDSAVNILSVQDDLITVINDQLVEYIFNKAFTNW